MINFKEKYGQYALVTGGTSGIGKALSYEIAKHGVNLILVARGSEELKRTAEEIKSRYNVDAVTIQADLSKNEGIEQVIRESEPFEVGLFVPAAGLDTNGLFSKINIDKELALLQLNVISTLSLTHHFVKSMIDRKRGGVLLVSSLSGHMPNPYLSNYAGSKAYVLNLGLSLYGELRQKGVDVSVLSPGLTDTPMAKGTGIDWDKTPMKKMEAGEVAAIAIKQLGKKASIVPGGMNKMMAFMAKYMMPFGMGSKMNEGMMRKALPLDRI